MQICQIEVLSHGVKVTKIEVAAMQVLREYALQLIQYKVEKVRQQFIRTAERVFAASTADRTEWRFHRHELDNLLDAFKRRGYEIGKQINVIYVPLYPLAVLDAKMPDSWKAREEQIPVIDYIVSEGHTKIVTAQTGTGKATSLDCPVKVPGGWKRMGDIQVGDRVIAWDGTPTNVVAVYPQPEMQLYRVTFADGRSVKVCGQHLWKIYYINTTVNRRWQVVDTHEMKRLISMPNPRVYIPLPEPEDCPELDYVVPPYTMGVILGDGGISQGCLNITKPDEEVRSRIVSELHDSLVLTPRDHLTFALSKKPGTPINIYVTELRKLHLMGCKSNTKFIPEAYLRGSIEQRKALLQGLMDTDGTIGVVQETGKGGGVNYSTTSQKLAHDVQYLVRSLGGIASISNKQTYYTYKGVKKAGLPSFVVNIRVKKPSELFTVKRKADRTNDDNQYAGILKLRVKSIEPWEVAKSQCITIDHPDALFVVKDFVVTHNTAMALKGAEKIGHRLLVTVLGRYLEKWKSDLIDNYGLKPQELVVARGQKQLHTLLEAAHTGQLPKYLKAVLVTTDTIADYIALYEATKFIALPKHLVAPERIYEVLQVGFRIIDECHQNFHANFKIDLYTHIPKALYLSATLESDNPFIDKMYKVAYPMSMRVNGGKYIQYCNVVNIEYQLEDPRKVKYKNSKGQYSQNDYEQWIMKDAKRLKNYLELIWNIAKVEYLSDYVEGQRLLILAGRTEMCAAIAKYIDDRLVDHTVSKYTSAEDYDVLMTSDVSVSTYGSAGTAVDIANLTTCICTIAMSASQGNLQILGRLRQLKLWPHRKPKFLYLTCLDVPSHRAYHEKKRELFKGKALTHTSMTSRFRV